MNVTSIIRNKGQLTIPDSIRKTLNWVSPMSAVTISVVRPDEIVIKPHKKEVDWNKLWKQMKRVRAFKGTNKGSLSDFIIKDRETHF
jgi:bifunctional DNA-binding transcriptional regulator/antitoxin component of YhaV-PrlF toxin-antitoxin module